MSPRPQPLASVDVHEGVDAMYVEAASSSFPMILHGLVFFHPS